MFIERTLFKCLYIALNEKMKKKENVRKQIKLMKKNKINRNIFLESIIISCYEI